MSIFNDDFSRAGSILAVIYLLGIGVILLGPETKVSGLRED
jgi:hypothetical protein